MSDVIPTVTSPDSEFLFERMTSVTLDLARAAPGRRILDVGSGVGQDSVALAQRGVQAVGAEPSARMIALAEAFCAKEIGEYEATPEWVRSWADALPFAADQFDASFCKGALDHFDAPETALAEMARVTRPDGRVVVAVANFDSLACRVARAIDEVREDWLGLAPLRKRRGYDTPSDHFTRYEVDLIKEQASRYLEIDTLQGISIGWGLPGWASLVRLFPKRLADVILRALDALGRQWPFLADVVVVAGRPRRRSTQESTISA